jgi:hypothetical protein
VRQPGVVGCLAGASSYAVCVLSWAAWEVDLFWAVPVTVMAVWIVLASRRILRPESGWIDRLGRTVAAMWGLVGLLASVVGWLG